MSVTISTNPGELFLSGNKAKVKLVGLNGAKAALAGYSLLSLPTNPSYNTSYSEAFTLTFNGVTVTIYAVASPSANNQIGLRENYASYDEYFNDCIVRLSRNPYLFSNYIITPGQVATQIKIQAREKGAKWSINAMARRLNITFFNYNYSDGAEGNNLFYKVGVDILKNNDAAISVSKSPVVVYTPGQPYDNQETDIDIAKFIKKRKTGHYTLPEPTSAAVKHTIVDKCVLVGFEQYGMPIVKYKSGVSNPFYVLHGKLSDITLAQINADGDTFLDYLTVSKKFLSQAPVIKTTDIYSPEKLYFLALATDTFTVKVRKTYKCGNTATIIYGVFAANKYDVFEIMASYAAIKTDDSYRIYKYEIWVEAVGGTVVSEVRTYKVSRKYEPWARYFLFKNSLGVYEVFRTTGKVEKNLDVKKELIQVDDETSSSYTRKYVETSSETAISYKVNSGNIDDKNFLAFIQELVESDDVFIMKGKKLYPVNITKCSDSLDKDSEPINSVNFTMEHLSIYDFSSDFIEASPLVPQFNNDFNDDFAIDFQTVSADSNTDNDLLADAGADQSNLNGLTTLLDANIPTWATGKWTVQSGPGNVIFDRDTDNNTAITVSEPGTYILNWTLTGGTCKDTDSVQLQFNTIEQEQIIITEDFSQSHWSGAFPNEVLAGFSITGPLGAERSENYTMGCENDQLKVIETSSIYQTIILYKGNLLQAGRKYRISMQIYSPYFSSSDRPFVRFTNLSWSEKYYSLIYGGTQTYSFEFTADDHGFFLNIGRTQNYVLIDNLVVTLLPD